MKIKSILLLSILSLNSFAANPVHSTIIGMMQCVPGHSAISGGMIYDRRGCKDNEVRMSFKKYFEKYRQSDTDEISHIVYDAYQNIFHIYYTNVFE